MTTTSKLRVGGDVEVARIGLGTNRLTDTPDNNAFLRDAVAVGIGMIDAAHTYSGGQSESIIGEALPSSKEWIVATKGGIADGRAEALRSEIDASLRRLRTDSIALSYLHRVDRQTTLEESLSVLAEYREAGKIRPGSAALVLRRTAAARDDPHAERQQQHDRRRQHPP